MYACYSMDFNILVLMPLTSLIGLHQVLVWLVIIHMVVMNDSETPCYSEVIQQIVHTNQVNLWFSVPIQDMLFPLL